MSRADTARSNYSSARAELTQRIQQRDNVLSFYLGAVGALLSVALGSTKPELLLSIPFLSLGVCILVAQHNSAIGALTLFCTNELGQFLKSLSPSEDAPQWDNSFTAKTYHKESMRQLLFGHIIILSLPSFAFLIVNYGKAFPFFSWMGYIWWCSLVAAILNLMVVIRSYTFRKKVYRKYDWRQSPHEVLSADS